MVKQPQTDNAMKTRISRMLLMIATVFTMGYARAAEPVRFNESKERGALERNLDRALNRHRRSHSWRSRT